MTGHLFFLCPPGPDVRWMETNKGSAALRRLADAHYTRQTPGSAQFCRPGVNLCLITSDGLAGWIVWRPIPEVGRMDNLEAWECTLFRNEGPRLSSDLVREATDATHRAWGWPPRDGLISAVGIAETRRRRGKRSPPGRCFVEAGWRQYAERDGKAWLIAPRPVRTEREVRP